MSYELGVGSFELELNPSKKRASLMGSPCRSEAQAELNGQGTLYRLHGTNSDIILIPQLLYLASAWLSAYFEEA